MSGDVNGQYHKSGIRWVEGDSNGKKPEALKNIRIVKFQTSQSGLLLYEPKAQE